MKLSQTLAFLLFFCLCFIGCRDDEYFSDETEIPIDTGVIVEGNLNGLIVNDSNQPIPQVLIEVMGEAIYTDDNGFFRLAGINLDNNGSLVTISKEGYFNSYKFTYAEPGEDSYIRHVLPARGGAQYPNAAGYTIPLNGGGDITIPPNSVTYLDGSAYNDRVYVHQYWYDPSDPNLASYMPGDLRGINNDGDLVQLVTYGMIAVELETASGEPLQISEDLPATLKFPIPDNFSTRDSIPMWHLNEDTGHWIEEGVSVRQGNFMVAEVTHFSFWNCDAPYPLVELTGTLVDQNGSPLSNQLISITTDNMLTGTGHTNENGYFRGKVPQGLNLNLSINVCSDEAHTNNLGSFDIDTDLDVFTVNVDTDITINTVLVNCMGQPISGYAFIQTDVSTEVVVTDDDGLINLNLFTCNNGEGTIRGIDNINGNQSEEIRFSLSDTVVNIDDIQVCGEQIETGKIKYSLGGGETTLSDPEVVIVDETYLYIYGEGESTGPNKEGILLMFLIEGKTHIPEAEEFLLESEIAGYDSDGNFIGLALNPSSFENLQTTPVQEVGDALVGVFQVGSIEIELNLIVNQKVTTGTIRGKRWIDDNNDGIKDDTENWSPDLCDFKAESRDPNQRLLRYYKGMPFNGTTFGDYLIHGLVPDQEYKITWGCGANSSIDVSPAYQGSDDTKDCDFVLNSIDEIYETEYFLINEGQTIENIGFGYTQNLSCEIGPRCCPVDAISFTIYNGNPPYTINLSKGGIEYGPFIFNMNEFSILNSDFGEYEIEVTDAQNNSCTKTYKHNEYINAINGQAWIDEGDIPGQFDNNDRTIGDIEINLYNDDGELVFTSYTDPFGRYLFQNLIGDSYRIQVIIPNEYEFIELGDPLESRENHIDPQTGFSHFINVGNWDFDILYNLSAGFKEK